MKLVKKYKELFRDRRFLFSLFVGIFMVVLAAWLTTLAQDYANSVSSNPVSDFLLDRLPAFPWPAFLVYFLSWGSLVFALTLLLIVSTKPEYFPSTLKTLALLYMVRAFFISVTHLKLYDGPAALDGYNALTASLADVIYNSHDLFFSGHTALPFVAALIFWKHKAARYYFLITAILFATGVLWAGAHYSIDVFAAPFMGYAIFAIAQRIFKSDYQRLPT
jgi:hypothetical protein